MKNNKKYILGLSCFYHDAAACLLEDGKLIAAASEERFTRKKQDESFPNNAVNFCLDFAGVNIEDIDYVCFYEKPIVKFDRLIQTYIKTWPRGLKSFLKSMPIWLGEKLWIQSVIKDKLKYKNDVLFIPHHLSHAASSYFTSFFDSATIVTIDGVGEWATTTIGYGKDNKLFIDKEVHFPHSLGLFYSAFTYYLGFRVNSAEYKVMGLAPYGEPKYVDKIKELIKIFPDGSFELDMRYFAYEHDLKMINKRFAKHFGNPVRKEEDELEQFHKDMAASLQKVLEEVVLKIVDNAYQLHPNDNLCLAGGVALNCVANGRIIRESKFKNLFIHPAAGDAGGAVGCAYYLYNHALDNKDRFRLEDVYLGPHYPPSEIKSFLDNHQVPYKEYEDEALYKLIAEKINENNVIGLFQGRMEFGPRALGNRSIIADPRKEENWQRVNLKIKFRESFRPFAPTVLSEKISDVFEIDRESPYMLLVAQVKRKDLPAITHVDNSARIQSISKKQNNRYYQIIKEFYQLTNCPVVINTSFNVRGEPIVCSYEDALKCFLRTDMDILVLENFVIDVRDLDKKELAKQFTFEKMQKD